MKQLPKTPAPDMTFRAMVVLDNLRYGHSREEAIAALAISLHDMWQNGYSNGEGDVLADEAEKGYRQFGEVMAAITESDPNAR